MSTTSEMENLITLHGLMGTSFSHFGPVLDELKHSFRLFPVDFPGHGQCPVDSMPNYYESVTGWFVKALEKVGSAHVIAASYLGGTIAVRAAIQYPQYFKSLTLTGFVSEVPNAAFTAWASSFNTLADTNQHLQEIYTQLHGARWRETLNLVTTDCRNNYDSAIYTKWDWIDSFSFPVLLVNGDYKQNERQAVQRYQGAVSGLTAVLIEGAGHMVPSDRPAEFTSIVKEFLVNQYEI